jgi:hypothetical protein
MPFYFLCRSGIKSNKNNNQTPPLRFSIRITISTSDVFLTTIFQGYCVLQAINLTMMAGRAMALKEQAKRIKIN